MPQWTEQQQQAIQARNGTLLISAAAGSGKTAVLVERIMSLLREGASWTGCSLSPLPGRRRRKCANGCTGG